MLSGAGHEALHVIDVGLRDASDAMIWDHAVAQGMAILTKDEDFASRRLRSMVRRSFGCASAIVPVWLWNIG